MNKAAALPFLFLIHCSTFGVAQEPVKLGLEATDQRAVPAGNTPPKDDVIEVTPDVVVFDMRQFEIPIGLPAAGRENIATIRFSVSYDLGKTWKVLKNCQPTDQRVTFSAERDGLVYFSAQGVLKDGKVSPPRPRADLKVLINEDGKTTKVVQPAQGEYKLGPDSMRQPDVPARQSHADAGVEERDLPRHRARLVDLCPRPVRCGQARLRHDLSGRRRLRQRRRAPSARRSSSTISSTKRKCR